VTSGKSRTAHSRNAQFNFRIFEDAMATTTDSAENGRGHQTMITDLQAARAACPPDHAGATRPTYGALNIFRDSR
jgi:hypothetical protein